MRHDPGQRILAIVLLVFGVVLMIFGVLFLLD